MHSDDSRRRTPDDPGQARVSAAPAAGDAGSGRRRPGFTLTRRELFTLGAIAGAGILGWSTSTPAVASPWAGAVPALTGAPGPGGFEGAKRGGAVTTVWAERPQSFDPAIGWDFASWEAMCQLIFTTPLQFQGQDGLPAPSAAESLPEVSPDGTVLTIRFRPGMLFHNGREILAADYAYAWTRVLTPDLASWASNALLGIAGAQEYYDGDADSVTGLEVLDDHTLRVTLVRPDISFFGILCQPYMAAVPQEVVEKLGAEEFGRHPIGNGPFRVVSWDDERRQAVFERFDDYFWEGTPLLDRVTYRWGITPELQVLQIRDGAADITGDGLTPTQAALLHSQGASGEQYIEPVAVNAVQWVAMNVTKGPLKDVRVRRALALATDRKALAKVGFGTTTPSSLPFPGSLPDYRSTTSAVAYNPKKARRILDEAGYGRIKLEFIHGGDSPWPNNAQMLQQQWAKIGVDITITAMGKAAFDWAIYAQQGDLYGTRWYLGQPTALDLLNACWVSDAGSNYTGYSNAQVDALTLAASAAPTVAESNRILADVEEILQEDAAGIFIASLNFIAGRSTRLRNFQYRGEVGTCYDRLWVGKGSAS